MTQVLLLTTHVYYNIWDPLLKIMQIEYINKYNKDKRKNTFCCTPTYIIVKPNYSPVLFCCATNCLYEKVKSIVKEGCSEIKKHDCWGAIVWMTVDID